jgi:hypothetical protein
MVVDPVNQRFKAIGPSTDQATDLLIRWVNYTGIRWSVEKNKKTNLAQCRFGDPLID